MPSQEWIEECMKYYGRVLTGGKAHFCYDWDGLPIDETCGEYQCCTCFGNKEATTVIDFVLNDLK